MKEQYARILDTPRPEPIRPRMDLVNRANIFASFDALRGFDFAIMTEEYTHALTQRVTLSQDQKEEIGWKLAMLQPGDPFRLTWFEPDKRSGELALGRYVTETMTFEGIDPLNHILTTNEKRVPFRDIRDLSGDVFERREVSA